MEVDELDTVQATVPAERIWPLSSPVSDASDVQEIRDNILNIASEISKMEVKPELLRATSPSSALRFFGSVLWRHFRGDLFHLSFATKKIDCFWSHSWHATSWMKIMVLLVYYNGRAALVGGSAAACLGLTLFFLELLPTWPRGFSLEGATYDVGPWGFIFGCLASILVLLLWMPRGSRVFLDRICIHQSDEKLKSAGVMSIGGFLKHSKSMLVLLDPSYPTRLWTIFEVAAFLRSHQDATDRLIIRPTFLGPGAVAGFFFFSFMTLGFILSDWEAVEAALPVQTTFMFVIFAAFSHWLRGYFRQIEECHTQVRNFSLNGVKSYCCSMNHVDATGTRMLCDREIILECIRSWFGSDEEFEQAVRSQVSSALMKGVGYSALPYSWFVGVSLPMLWGYLDLAAARFRVGATFNALMSIIYTLVIWLGGASFGYFTTLWSCFKLRKQRANRCCDLLVTLMGTCILIVSGFAVHVMQPVLVRATGLLPGLLLYGLLMTISTLLARRLWLRATRTASYVIA